MILHIDSNTAYLVLPKAKSYIARYYYLYDHSKKMMHPKLNGEILVECKTLYYVVISLAEAKTAGVFHNAQIDKPIQYLFECLRYHQPLTPIKTDNSIANVFIHNNIYTK